MAGETPAPHCFDYEHDYEHEHEKNWRTAPAAGRSAMFDALEILSEDEDLLALNKPAGISVLAERQGGECLWDRLREDCAARGKPRPLLVHRLDKATSGVLLVAYSTRAQRSLQRQLTLRQVHKAYLALTRGAPKPFDAMIDLPLRPGRKGRFRVAGLRETIALDPSHKPAVWRLGGPEAGGANTRRTKEISDAGGHPSQTHYRVVRRPPEAGTMVLLRPLTGRTHQLRVHLSWLGWPIVGDDVYGLSEGARTALRRQPDRAPLTLHCRKIAFREDWKPGQAPRHRVLRAPLPRWAAELLSLG